jgi:hypothetical protein
MANRRGDTRRQVMFEVLNFIHAKPAPSKPPAPNATQPPGPPTSL